MPAALISPNVTFCGGEQWARCHRSAWLAPIGRHVTAGTFRTYQRLSGASATRKGRREYDQRPPGLKIIWNSKCSAPVFPDYSRLEDTGESKKAVPCRKQPVCCPGDTGRQLPPSCERRGFGPALSRRADRERQRRVFLRE